MPKNDATITRKKDDATVKPDKALCKSLEDKNINEFGDLQRAMMNHLSKNDAMPPIFINSLRKRINL